MGTLIVFNNLMRFSNVQTNPTQSPEDEATRRVHESIKIVYLSKDK